MPFRFANVSGRAALVDADDQWYDLASLTGGTIGPDPMAALAIGDELHQAAAGLADATPDGALADADARVAGPGPPQRLRHRPQLPTPRRGVEHGPARRSRRVRQVSQLHRRPERRDRAPDNDR